MKKTFHEFFRLSEDEFNALWQAGLISFDANVLLNLYRYSPQSSNSLVELIRNYSDRIRLPHQFALEYARNRPRVIMDQVKFYSKAEADLVAFERDLISSKRQHPHLSDEALDAFRKIVDELVEKRKAVERLMSADPYADFILTACAGKVGEVMDDDRLNESYAKGKARYENLIPPGFADIYKGSPECYGDYIAWEQLISISTTEKRGIILVIDDLKEDWWWIESGRTVGPRPELLSEFVSRSGQRIWLYSSEGFLRAATRYVGAAVSESLLKDVRAQLEDARRRQLETKDKLKTIDEELPNEAKERADISKTDKAIASNGEVQSSDKPSSQSFDKET